MSYLDDFSPEHDPRPEHAVPWIQLPDARDVALAVRRAGRLLVDRVRYFDPVDTAETAVARVQAFRQLLSSRP